LDPLTARTLQKFILERKGSTIIATHSPQLVEKVANKVYILTRGQVKLYGEVDDTIKKYGSIEDAYFENGGEIDA
jgi:ABC-type multidrug transport system ATPase subunit